MGLVFAMIFLALTAVTLEAACGPKKQPAMGHSETFSTAPDMPKLQIPSPVIPTPPTVTTPTLPDDQVAPSTVTPNSSPDSPAPSYPPGDIQR